MAGLAELDEPFPKEELERVLGALPWPAVADGEDADGEDADAYKQLPYPIAKAMLEFFWPALLSKD